MEAVKINNINKATSEFFMLDACNLELKSGNIYGLIGPNGAGKTTLMKCLCGLLKPDSGSLEVDGNLIEMNNKDLLRKIGTNFVTSDSLNGFKLNEIYNDHVFYYDVKESQSIEQLLSDVGLKVSRELEFSKISLGMKQRFLLGLATIHDPSIILLDEPFNGLDPDGVDLFIENVKELSKNRVLIISSHVLRDMETFLDDG